MRTIPGYANTIPYTGEVEDLPLGGHICKIIKAEYVETRSGREQLVLLFDICEGSPSDGFYKRKHESQKRTNPQAKWQGIYRQLLPLDEDDTRTAGFFKGMVTCIEASNSGFNFEKTGFDENTLKGKFFGGLFGREEFLDDKGVSRFSTKCRFVRTVKAVKEGIEPPEDKLLPETSVPTGGSGWKEMDSIASDDDLPF